MTVGEARSEVTNKNTVTVQQVCKVNNSSLERRDTLLSFFLGGGEGRGLLKEGKK